MNNSIIVNLNGIDVTISDDRGYAAASELEHVLTELYDGYEDPLEVLKSMKGEKRRTEILEEQLYFARELVQNIKDFARCYKRSGVLKDSLKSALENISAEIENSQLEL